VVFVIVALPAVDELRKAMPPSVVMLAEPAVAVSVN